MDNLELMRLGSSYRFPVKLREFTIMLRPLTVLESITVMGETKAHLEKLPKYNQNAITEHVLFSQKTLQLASTSKPDGNDPTITEHELSQTTPDELTYLFKEYLAVADKVNPAFDALPVETLNKLVAEAKKNDLILIELSFSEIVNVCRYLISESSQAGN